MALTKEEEQKLKDVIFPMCDLLRMVYPDTWPVATLSAKDGEMKKRFFEAERMLREKGS